VAGEDISQLVGGVEVSDSFDFFLQFAHLIDRRVIVTRHKISLFQ
jgi:hypothetical protein